MTYRNLKEHIDKMEDWQLDQPLIVFDNDEEIGKEINCLELSKEDIYWNEGDCFGGIKETIEWINDNNDEELTIEDFTKIPKGQPTLHIIDG